MHNGCMADSTTDLDHRYNDELAREILSELLGNKTSLQMEYENAVTNPRGHSPSERSRIAEAHARVSETLYRIMADRARTNRALANADNKLPMEESNRENRRA